MSSSFKYFSNKHPVIQLSISTNDDREISKNLDFSFFDILDAPSARLFEIDIPARFI
jgi:hypothetical protein